MQHDPVILSNENYRQAFVEMSRQLPSGAVRRFGSLTATSTGLPVAAYNRIFAFAPPNAADCAAAVRWLSERGDPFWITATDDTRDEIVPLADSHGYELIESQPGMVLAPLEEIPAQASPAEIEVVTDPAELEDLIDVFSAVFGTPRDVTANTYDESYLDHDRLELFMGYVDGEAVACGLLFRDDGVAGVYSIGVLEAYRRRGIGTDMTWAVLAAGREAGCEVGVLQSSELGYPVYEQVGFETVVTYHQFATRE